MDMWQARYESLREAVAVFEGQLREARSRIALLEAEKKQWEMEKLMQQAVIQQAVNTVNATSQSYLEENQRLRAENQRLRDGHHD
jgi:hypothetical protein